MGKHRNLWRPDTCACVIEYEFDDEVPPEERVHVGYHTFVVCAAHQGLSVEDHHTVLVEENLRKNKVHGALLTDPDLARTVPHDDGTSHVDLKPGLRFLYAFDEARTLRVHGPSLRLSPGKQQALQAACDATFGAGKVLVT